MTDRLIKAGLYGRISSDPDHDAKGVQRQIGLERKMITDRGGTIVVERVDNDISAKDGRHRPGYSDLMSLAEAGVINAIVVYQQSRLWRNREERAVGIERLSKVGCDVLVVKGPDLQMGTAYGRAIADMSGVWDTWESEVKSERVREKALEIALAGGIAAGGPRPFGYRRIKNAAGRIVRDELEPTEAKIVRQLAKRFLAGESLRSLVTDLNQRGIRTSTGGSWTMQGLRIILKSARIAGLREHHGQVVAKAVWPAIISKEDHEALRAKLDGRTRPPGSRVRVHYLSGMVHCRRCGAKMKTTGSHTGPKYGCPADGGGCNGTIIGRPELEEFVGRYLCARLDTDEFKREVQRRTRVEGSRAKTLARKLDEAEKRLEVLGASLKSAGVDQIPQAVTALAEARSEVQQLRDQRDRIAGVPATVTENAGLTYEQFVTLPLDAKRDILGFLVERVVIGPAQRGYGKFDPRRVEIIPR